jgi:hypothetical protein
MINLMTPINQLGYGVAGLNILKALQAQTDVALHMIGQPQVTNQADADAVNKGLQTAQMFDPKATCVKIWHQNQMAERIGSGKFIGFPIFELDTFTDLEKHHLNSCDEIMVCSKWAKEIIMKNCYYPLPPEVMDAKIHIIPLGVDSTIFKPAPLKPAGSTVFFNCGKWEVRKGHDLLAGAFKEHLKTHPDSQLWMMCSNPFNSPEENQKWLSLYDHPNIRIIPRAETQQEVYNIMSQVDCGVFPSRGEGWNLELLEMMAVGKPTIATNYSAHTEFVNDKNCFLLHPRGLEPAFDNKWFFGQGNWAEIWEQDITEVMNYYVETSRCPIAAALETAKKFSWENTANEILKHI